MEEKRPKSQQIVLRRPRLLQLRKLKHTNTSRKISFSEIVSNKNKICHYLYYL